MFIFNDDGSIIEKDSESEYHYPNFLGRDYMTLQDPDITPYNYTDTVLEEWKEDKKPVNPLIWLDENGNPDPYNPENWERNDIDNVYDDPYKHIFITPITIEDDDIIPKYHRESKLTNISDADSLYKYARKCAKPVSWKDSTETYMNSFLTNICRVQKDIDSGHYRFDPPYEFTLNERGHNRDIKAQSFRDRNMQASLNYNILLPRLQPKLIYDNGASQEGKGLSFTKRRFEEALRAAFKEFGPEGVIVFIDFSKYFDNIRHEDMLNMAKPYLNDAEYDFLVNCFKQFRVDVSYMTDEQYKNCMDEIFNSLDYAAKIPKDLRTGEKWMSKSVGIGSQTSQITGIYYPHEIDNYCKIVRGIKYYGRYMDDTFFIVRTIEEAYDILNHIQEICKKLGIFMNMKKTRILHLKDKMSFLKTNYKFRKSDNKLIRKTNSKAIRREYRKITKLKHLYDRGDITLEDAVNSYKSWEGSYIKSDSSKAVMNNRRYFLQTFNLSAGALKKHGDIKVKENNVYKISYNAETHKKEYTLIER